MNTCYCTRLPAPHPRVRACLEYHRREPEVIYRCPRCRTEYYEQEECDWCRPFTNGVSTITPAEEERLDDPRRR